MKSGMPYAYALAKRYGYATSYYATTHPSLPNYLAMASGSTFSVKDDKSPSSHPLKGQTVFGQAIVRGKTAKTYAESMTSNCQTSNTGKYYVKHNPWAYYVDERSLCNKYDVPFTKFSADVYAGRLPNIGMVIPNICNVAHDCSLGTADKWVKALFASISQGPDWKSGHLLVILTADEDDKNHNNNILTVMVHPSLNGKVVTAYLNHYSLTKLYSEVVGASPLRNGANARSLSSSFGLPM
jgi:acid phosphatase